ncbi:MAG: hypothetical protein QM489_00850 [Candidatus Izemoplasma sp.]
MKIKDFEEFLQEQTIDILSNRDLVKDLTKAGFKVSKAKNPAGTFIVQVNSRQDKKKLLNWMLKNGWDKTDIKDGYDTEFKGLV